MHYERPTFTLPTSVGVSKAEWDRIWKDYTPPKEAPKTVAPFPTGRALIRAVLLEDLKFNAPHRKRK